MQALMHIHGNCVCLLHFQYGKLYFWIVNLCQVDFTVDEHDAIQSALRQHLGPSFISQRVGAGGQKVCLVFGNSSCNFSTVYFIVEL